MNTNGVYILNKANCYLVVLSVTNDFELQLFPAVDTLFNENLANERSLESSCTDYLQLVNVVDHTAAGAAHCISRTENYRIFELFSYLYSLVNAVSYLASGHTDAELTHSVFELDTVLTTLDSIHLYTNDLNAVLFKYTGLIQLRAEVESGLSAEVRQECVRTLLVDYLGKSVKIQRLDVCDISNIGVRHDSCGVRIHENNLISQLTEGLAGLGAGIVEFAGLSDDDRT